MKGTLLGYRKLPFASASVMMAEETVVKRGSRFLVSQVAMATYVISHLPNGPMKDDVLPMTEKTAKNKNSFPLGTTSEIIVCEYAYQGQTRSCNVTTNFLCQSPKAHELRLAGTHTIESLITPDLPNIMETKPALCDPYHSPCVKNQDPESDEEKHSFGRDLVASLDYPE